LGRRRPAASQVDAYVPVVDDLPPILLAVRHIGPRRARRLIDTLGEGWRDVLDLAPERVFVTLRGVGAEQARAATESWLRLTGTSPTPRRPQIEPQHELASRRASAARHTL
jgi:hypothetical protein